MRSPGNNPGCARACGDCADCRSPLAYGASCASSCVHVARCRLLGQLGSEGACRFIPSQYEPNPHHMDVLAASGRRWVDDDEAVA